MAVTTPTGMFRASRTGTLLDMQFEKRFVVTSGQKHIIQLSGKSGCDSDLIQRLYIAVCKGFGSSGIQAPRQQTAAQTSNAETSRLLRREHQRKSLLLTSKSELLTRKSLLLTSKSEMLTRKSLLLTSKSELLTRKSLLLTSSSEMLMSKSLLLMSKAKCSQGNRFS